MDDTHRDLSPIRNRSVPVGLMQWRKHAPSMMLISPAAHQATSAGAINGPDTLMHDPSQDILVQEHG